jgi:predicted nicotinamide N-methyase
LHDRFILDHTELVSPPLLPEIRLRLAKEMTPLWTKTQQSSPPYWAFAWVGGQALARFVLDRPEHVRGKRVLDFASGSGLVAIAAKKSGAARVVASDVDPMAVCAIESNARANDTEIEITCDDLVGDALDDVDLLLAGDVCYERPMADRVGAWLCDRARAGRDVVIGDPGRSHLLAPDRLLELARYDVSTIDDVESTNVRSTGVFRVRG